MKKSVFKISIAVFIILLGLTAVAPEWLELKDMIISDYKKQDIESYPKKSFSYVFAEKTANTATFIKERIVGQDPNYSGWFSIINNGLWSLFNILKAIIFVIFTFFLFLALNNGFKRIYKPQKMPLKSIFYFTTLSMSFGFTLFIWPYLVAATIGIALLFNGVFT